MSDSTSRNGFSVLRHRNFTLYLTARTFATLAVQMQNVAIGWQVYAMTHDLFDLGMIGLAQFAPFLLLILLAGHAADSSIHNGSNNCVSNIIDAASTNKPIARPASAQARPVSCGPGERPSALSV